MDLKEAGFLVSAVYGLKFLNCSFVWDCCLECLLLRTVGDLISFSVRETLSFLSPGEVAEMAVTGLDCYVGLIGWPHLSWIISVGGLSSNYY